MKTRSGLRNFLCAVVFVCAVQGVPAFAQGAVDRAFMHVELYVWNRFADLLEIMRGGVAVGPAVGAEVAVTEYAQIGAYWAKEQGVTFPHFLPPLWLVPMAEGEKVFLDHSGRYWTYSVGPYRRESSEKHDVRFPRGKYDVRAQVAVGIAQLYANIDMNQVGDFVVGFVGFDPAKDDAGIGYQVRREPARQLGRGMSNVLTGAWEIPYNIYTVNKDQGGFAAVTYGLVRGIWRCGVRELTGVMEVVTFPFGWGPIVEPEFPFQPVKSTDWRVNPLPFREP